MSALIAPAQRVLQRRLERRFSQAQLASLAGISRTAVSAIEGGKLTPSVAVAMALAAVFECTVEELFGAFEPETSTSISWAWEPPSAEPRYWLASVGSRVRGYPVETTLLNPLPHDGRGPHPQRLASQATTPSQTLVLASCDPAAGLLASAYMRTGSARMLIYPRSGRRALEMLKEGLVHVAGIHRSTPTHPEANAQAVRQTLGHGYKLLRAAIWEEGIALRDKSAVHPRVLENSPRLSWAAREQGSAARECLDELLGGRKFKGREVGGHTAVSEAVHSGWADAGICIRLSAEEAALDFIPLRQEFLDFCYHESLEGDPLLRALKELVRSKAHRRWLADLPGYDTTTTGEIEEV